MADFDESGGDMILDFIDSMNRKKGALESAVAQTASIISDGMNDDFQVATTSNVNQTIDYSGGLSKIEQAITAQVATSGANTNGTWVFPIYIGGDHIDTLVVDAIDRYNYRTGGH